MSKQKSLLAELGHLLILAQLERQKKTSIVSPAKTKTIEVSNQRQPKASVNRDSTQR